MKSEDALLYRWAAALEDFDYEIKHRPGKKQGHVDALSRLPVLAVQQEIRRALLTERATYDVLQQLHRDCHMGVKKMTRTFNKRFQGTRTHVQAEQIVRECAGCQKGTDYKPRKKVTGHITSQRPWDMLSVDVVGPLPRTRQGQRFILSIIDCFSKYVILVPIADHTAETVSRTIYERVVGYFGAPSRILSDRGGEFRSQIWDGLMHLLGIQKQMTSPYYLSLIHI